MTGIMTPAVRLHHFRFGTYKISSSWFLLCSVYLHREIFLIKTMKWKPNSVTKTQYFLFSDIIKLYCSIDDFSRKIVLLTSLSFQWHHRISSTNIIMNACIVLYLCAGLLPIVTSNYKRTWNRFPVYWSHDTHLIMKLPFIKIDTT
jgi:hypothetical protein